MSVKFLDNPTVTALMRALVSELPADKLAEHAADGEAVVSGMGMMVKDKIDKSLTIGHASVVVIWGSETGVEQIREGLGLRGKLE